jgi:hypothetical protein
MLGGRRRGRRRRSCTMSKLSTRRNRAAGSALFSSLSCSLSHSPAGTEGREKVPYRAARRTFSKLYKRRETMSRKRKPVESCSSPPWPSSPLSAYRMRLVRKAEVETLCAFVGSRSEVCRKERISKVENVEEQEKMHEQSACCSVDIAPHLPSFHALRFL